jgi:hypothetical protein
MAAVWLLCQLGHQLARLAQDYRAEPFTETPIDRGDKLPCNAALPLICQASSETKRSAQLE